VRGSREPFRAAWLVTAVLVALALPCAEPAQRSCPSPHVLGTGDGGVSPLVACDGAGEGALGGALPLLFGGRIDLAGADAAALDVLPGVGPALASAILAERERAPFCTLGELERVHGIGPRTLARLAPWLEVGRDPRCARLSDPGGGP
jgi:competence protein ComEA